MLLFGNKIGLTDFIRYYIIRLLHLRYVITTIHRNIEDFSMYVMFLLFNDILKIQFFFDLVESPRCVGCYFCFRNRKNSPDRSFYCDIMIVNIISSSFLFINSI